MHKKFKFSLCFSIFIAAICSSSCNQKTALAQSKTAEAQQSLFIMAYNVENLFDIKDDPKKDDATFLPYEYKKNKKHYAHCAKLNNYKWKKQCLDLDWNKEAYETKIKNISHVIANQNNGKGPDILFLQEVENIHVLNDLNAALPEKIKFQSISLIEGKDSRGIDVAFMSKLPLRKPAKLLSIPFKNISKSRKKDTRGILFAEYTLPNGKSLGAYSVHFPAPYHPKEFRKQAFNYLNKLKSKHKKLDYHIAAGDFNVTREESDKHLVFESIAQKQWLTPHLSSKRYAGKTRIGSNYYGKKDSWSFLDTILLSKNFSDDKGWEYLDQSFEILNNTFIVQDEKKRPKSYDFVSKQGVSDHFPVGLNIILK